MKSSRTDRSYVHGQDPQGLIEKILRERIYECRYWKEECFGLTSETLLDKAVDLDHIGGSYANQRPVPFMCLVLRLLQLQPSKEIIHEYIGQEDFKYLRALGALYWRLVAGPAEVYGELEPLLADYRRLRVRLHDGKFALTTMDQFVDGLLREERVLEIILPRIPRRAILEDQGELEPRLSLVEGATESSLTVPTFVEDEQADFKESMTLEETNALRIKLGLKPIVE